MSPKKEFRVIIERFFIASVPALRGCHTQAQSLDELMKRIKEATDLCLEIAGKALTQYKSEN